MRAGFHPRRQGDIGELSAMEWLVSAGAALYVPFGHSPDVDLVADFDGRLVRVQVKTCSYRHAGRWQVMLATHGGNQSWNGTVKRFSSERADYLFVHVADGRRWFIPTGQVGGTSAIVLGGPKYAAFEVDPGRPFSAAAPVTTLDSMAARRGTRAVKGTRL